MAHKYFQNVEINHLGHSLTWLQNPIFMLHTQLPWPFYLSSIMTLLPSTYKYKKDVLHCLRQRGRMHQKHHPFILILNTEQTATTVLQLQNTKIKALSPEESSSLAYFEWTLLAVFLPCLNLLVCSGNPTLLCITSTSTFLIHSINSLWFFWFGNLNKVLFTTSSGTACDTKGPADTAESLLRSFP